MLQQVRPGAEVIDVAKIPRGAFTSQERINELLVEHARAGKRVVRLKGGDPFVFGRGGEEVLACRAAGVPVRVVPGVTSAVSVPAAAGVPVTHREISRMFTVVSGHAPLSETELEHLAGLRSTVVVLMGVTNLPSITQGLVRHGLPGGTPVAIVERGWAEDQRTVFTTLDTALWDASAAGVESPAVLVIGEVVRLAHAGLADAHEVLRTAAASAGS